MPIIIRTHRCRRAVNTPMIAVAANITDVPKRTVPRERKTTLVPGCTDASYRLKAPGRREKWWVRLEKLQDVWAAG